MSVLLLDQDLIHYEVLGRGRPVIFLHGWVGSWRYWIPAMQSVSISYRAYALDLYGFGDTSKNQRHYNLDEQLQMLDNFLEKLGIMRFVVVGHGLGAILGLLYARKYPSFVDRVMAISLPLEEGCLNTRLRSDSPAELADWLVGRIPAGASALADTPKTDPLAVRASLPESSAGNLRELWRNPATPCLLVHGLNDPAVQPPRAEQMVEMPESMHAIGFDQSGHFPMLDQTNKFNRLVIDFLALASGESPRDLQLKEEWKRRVR